MKTKRTPHLRSDAPHGGLVDTTSDLGLSVKLTLWLLPKNLKYMRLLRFLQNIGWDFRFDALDALAASSAAKENTLLSIPKTGVGRRAVNFLLRSARWPA